MHVMAKPEAIGVEPISTSTLTVKSWPVEGWEGPMPRSTRVLVLIFVETRNNCNNHGCLDGTTYVVVGCHAAMP